MSLMRAKSFFAKEYTSFFRLFISSLTMILKIIEVSVINAEEPQSAESALDDCAAPYAGVIVRVNGEVITNSDLDANWRLTLFSVGGEKNITDAAKKELRQAELDKIIDDTIKWQFVTKLLKYNPSFDKSLLDKQVNEEVIKIAQQHKMSLEQFTQLLTSNNVDIAVLKHKIKTNIMWQEYLMSKLGGSIDNVKITPKNAATVLANQEKQLHQKSYNMHRMFFPVSSTSYADANKIKQMLLEGVSFGDISREFEGKYHTEHWKSRQMYANQLSEKEARIVETMEVGTCALIDDKNGYILLFLKDRQIAACNDDILKTVNVVLPFDPGLDPASKVYLMDEVKSMLKKSKNYDEFVKKAKESGIMIVTPSITMSLSKFTPKYRSLLSTVPVGGMSIPVCDDSGAIVVFCVLAKDTHVTKSSTIEEISKHITDTKINALANEELFHLRKIADIKYSEKHPSSIKNLKKL
jgi:hypothetical protein